MIQRQHASNKKTPRNILYLTIGLGICTISFSFNIFYRIQSVTTSDWTYVKGKERIRTPEPEIERKVKTLFQNDNEIRQGDKMKAIIHIGPHKTGTSSIQQVLVQSIDILKLDGYTMLEEEEIPGLYSYSAHNVALGLRGLEFYVNKNYLQQFREFLLKAQREKKNIVLSSEEFSVTKPETFHTIFSPLYESRIVIVYRRFFEVLASRHFEIQTKQKSIENFVFWVPKNLEKTKKASAIVLKEKFQEYFDDVVVMNYHAPGPGLLVSFFCNVIQGMAHMCRKVQTTKFEKINQSSSLHIRELIQAAKERTILDKEIEDTKVEAEIEYFMKTQLKIGLEDLPKRCLSEEILEEIFQWTLQEEMQLFPGRFQSMGGEQNLRSEFEKFKSIACQIKANEVLEDEKWVRFFRGVG